MSTAMLRLTGMLLLGWGGLQGVSLIRLWAGSGSVPPAVRVFATSLFVGAVLAHLVARWHWVAFLRTMGHEIAHTIAIFLTCGRIVEFQATPGNGGRVQHHGRFYFIIRMTPYVAPLCGLVVLASIPDLNFHHHRQLGLVLLGGALGVHATYAFSDIRACASVGWVGSDFGGVDRVGALAVVLGANLILLTTVASFGVSGKRGVVRQWRASTQLCVRIATHAKVAVSSAVRT